MIKIVRRRLYQGNKITKPISYTKTIVYCMERYAFFSLFFIPMKGIGLVLQTGAWEIHFPVVYNLYDYLKRTANPRVVLGNSDFELIKYDNGLCSIRRTPEYVTLKF